MERRTVCLFAFVLLWPVVGSTQTTINPDVSLIGDLRAFSHNDNTRPTQVEELTLLDPEIELMIAGYLNPYARADGVIAWHAGVNAEIEEAYVTFLRGLPLDANLRVGQYLLEFGRLNSTHPHAYSFIQRPLPHAEFFGHDGLRDMAVRAALLLPTGEAYTEVMGGVLKGGLLEPHHHGDDVHAEPAADGPVNVGWFARLTSSFAASEHAELAMGLSGLTAIHDPHEELRAWLAGFDLKYRWRPNRYTSLAIEGELLYSRRETAAGPVNAVGGYGYIDHRFRQRYNIGVIGEYAESVAVASEQEWRVGGFVGFAPVEETSLVRLAGSWTEPRDGEAFWTVTLQLVFGLGPHQPHSF